MVEELARWGKTITLRDRDRAQSRILLWTVGALRGTICPVSSTHSPIAWAFAPIVYGSVANQRGIRPPSMGIASGDISPPPPWARSSASSSPGPGTLKPIMIPFPPNTQHCWP